MYGLLELVAWVGLVMVAVTWVSFLAFVVIILRRITQKRRRLANVLTVLTIVVGLWLPFWNVFPGAHLAENECLNRQRLGSPSQLEVPGYLMPMRDWNSGSLISEYRLATLLINDGYEFLERKVGEYNGFAKSAPGSGDYYRYYIGDVATEACKPFLYYLAHSSSEAEFRRMGLDKEHCITVEKVEYLKSEYGFYFTKSESGFPAYVHWFHTQIKNNKSGKVYAEYKSFTYGPYSCYSKDELDIIKSNIFTPLKLNHEYPTNKRLTKLKEVDWLVNFTTNQPELKIVASIEGDGTKIPGSIERQKLRNLTASDGNISFTRNTLVWIKNKTKRKMDLSEYSGHSGGHQILAVNDAIIFVLSRKVTYGPTTTSFRLLRIDWESNIVDTYPFVLPELKKESKYYFHVKNFNVVEYGFEMTFLDISDQYPHEILNKHTIKLVTPQNQ